MPKFRGNNQGRIVASGKQVAEALREFGFEVVRVRGDHLIMKDQSGQHITQVAICGRGKEALGQGELSKILRDIGRSKQDLAQALARG